MRRIQDQPWCGPQQSDVQRGSAVQDSAVICDMQTLNEGAYTVCAKSGACRFTCQVLALLFSVS